MSLRASDWSRPMTLDYVIGLLVTVGLLVYLTYALLRPEKF
jgi:K+-transporting ATPase KdpF subunit